LPGVREGEGGKRGRREVKHKRPIKQPHSYRRFGKEKKVGRRKRRGKGMWKLQVASAIKRIRFRETGKKNERVCRGTERLAAVHPFCR